MDQNSMIHLMQRADLAPQALLEQIHKTEAGKIASQLGRIAYRLHAKDEQFIIRFPEMDEETILKVFYTAQAMLEDSAIREVFKRYFP